MAVSTRKNRNRAGLTVAELQELADNINLDESDVDDNKLCVTEEDEDDRWVNKQGLGAYQNQILGTESEDDQANESSDDLPSGKIRKWERTTFHPQIERWRKKQMTVEIDSRLCTKDQKKCKRNPGQSMNLFCNDVGKDNIAYIIKPPPRRVAVSRASFPGTNYTTF
ncbi:hypothetical protein QE152_g6779 [Popillia japonica]|uniref:Uncharacterized protein n=1 Tax=Popillia japonica TaxID=7064 RepID=A0AAW1MHQ7_POPJA